jgi:phosphate transport system protein
MAEHLRRQIDKLKQLILALGTIVEESVQQAYDAFAARDARSAAKIIAGDVEIDLLEIDVEEECLHTLALYQPVALDLRYVVSVLKINNDLERIGDLAVNIAEQTCFIAQQPVIDTGRFDLSREAASVRTMLKKSLDALVYIDCDLAEEVRAMDDEVDQAHRRMYELVEKAILEAPDDVFSLINVLNVSRYLERIADHAVNISEDVIYMAKGDILRHRREHKTPK